MVAGLGLLSVVFGAVIASCAGRLSANVLPARVETLETGAGFLLISGFALTSLALPAIV